MFWQWNEDAVKFKNNLKITIKPQISIDNKFIFAYPCYITHFTDLHFIEEGVLGTSSSRCISFLYQ